MHKGYLGPASCTYLFMDADMKVESLIIQNNPQNGKTSRTLMLKHDWSKELGAKSENQKPFYFHVQISVYREDH